MKQRDMFPELKNNFSALYKELEDEYDNEFKEGIRENLKKMLKQEKMSNMKKSNKSTSESFGDVNGGSGNYTSRNKNTRTVKKRKFNPNNEDDSNLLITKEILKDLLNRITYEYENTAYLKKYLEHRIEEIIDINKLGGMEDN